MATTFRPRHSTSIANGGFGVPDEERGSTRTVFQALLIKDFIRFTRSLGRDTSIFFHNINSFVYRIHFTYLIQSYFLLSVLPESFLPATLHNDIPPNKHMILSIPAICAVFYIIRSFPMLLCYSSAAVSLSSWEALISLNYPEAKLRGKY
jgi:hypothetical protein